MDYDETNAADMSAYRSCRFCPRECLVDRTAGRKGVCGETAEVRTAALEAHMGEEPPISGSRGSGTVFFSGCALQCETCQNNQISSGGLGRITSVTEIVDGLADLYSRFRIHNVNFVTPDHFFPHTAAVVKGLRERGIAIPAVFNVSGYQRVESLRGIEPYADIYLPDFKYSDSDLAKRLSRCPDYPSIAMDAIAEMIRQKGILDRFTGASEDEAQKQSPAKKGVLVRHMVLPGFVQNSLDALSMLFIEFGGRLPLSLMSQYRPVKPVADCPSLGRTISKDEYDRVLDHARDLGFRDLFVQYPDEAAVEDDPFLPDFSRRRPFRGNRP